MRVLAALGLLGVEQSASAFGAPALVAVAVTIAAAVAGAWAISVLRS